MSRQGWVKFMREWYEDGVIHKDNDYLSVWIYLVTSAAYERTTSTFGGKRITLQPGQLTTGRNQLGANTHTQPDKAWRIIKRFESAHLITLQTSSKNSLISIVSWDDIQGNAQQNAQPIPENCTTTAQQMHTLEETRNKNNNYYTYAHSNQQPLDYLTQGMLHSAKEPDYLYGDYDY